MLFGAFHDAPCKAISYDSNLLSRMIFSKNYFSTDCKWSAEPQTIFEGNMKKMVKEALEKKVVWPWVAPNEDDSSRRKNILKSSGFKEWKNAKAKSAAENKWKLRYAIEAKTGKFENKFYKNLRYIFIIIFRYLRTIWQ